MSASYAQKESSFVPKRIGIVGLGLIGGSFAKALHAANYEVYGWNRSRDTLELALVETLDKELSDEYISTCELIILATYPQAAIEWLKQKAPFISPDALVIDTGGTKRIICKECFAIAKHYQFHFIACHPMAGTQYSGFAHARADMFVAAPMIVITPDHIDDIVRATVLERLQELLKPCGFAIWTRSFPQEHDHMIAYTSQLAHIVSNAYVKSPTAQRQRGFSAGSYKDLTRVAQLNPKMWTELFLENADNLISELDILIEHLNEYRSALAAQDAKSLHALLSEGDQLKKLADGLTSQEKPEQTPKKGCL